MALLSVDSELNESCWWFYYTEDFIYNHFRGSTEAKKEKSLCEQAATAEKASAWWYVDLVEAPDALMLYVMPLC